MFLEHVLLEDRDGVDRAFRSAMETRQTWDFECRIVRRDQIVRWIKAAGRHFNLGNSDRLVGVVQDISERKRAEESLAPPGGRIGPFKRGIGAFCVCRLP